MKKSFTLSWLPGKATENGNAWLPLWMHSMDTAYTMERLLNNWLPEHFGQIDDLRGTDLQKLCRFLALTHDIGKITPVFAARILERLPEIQQKLEATGLQIGTPRNYLCPGASPHAKAGEAVLLGLKCPRGIAAVVGAHHGRPQTSRLDCENDPSINGQNYYASDAAKSLWKTLRQKYFIWALGEAGYASIDELPEIRQSTQVLLTGLLIMADWIASNTYYYPLIPTDGCGDRVEYPGRANRAWEKLRLPEPASPMCFAMDAHGFRETFGFDPNPVQTMMMDAVNEGGGGIYILEAQMGVGKTEAALAAAEVLASKCGCDGIFFGLPTQATANGIFGRLLGWAKMQSEGTRQAIRLAHGMAELNEDYRELFRGTAYGNEDASEADGLIVHPWFSGRKQALLANYVIGTVDQLLMAALKQKHVMLRHLGLAGKVVILDECHAYDAYMNRYLDRALAWLGVYGVPVIVLSATLPESRRADLVKAYLNGEPDAAPPLWHSRSEYPLLTWTAGREVHQSTVEMDDLGRTVTIKRPSATEWLDLLRAAVHAGGCCGVIVNTVSKAQELTRTIAETIPEARTCLLHSRFVATDRAGKECDLLRSAGKVSTSEQRNGLVVIGTQVLEQSLDIDFDLLVTQLCPMDLLLQRMGRLHRHKRRRPVGMEQAVCCILDFDGGGDAGSRAIYGDWLLLRTRELLPEEVRMPESISQLVQETYREPDERSISESTHRNAWEAYEKTIRIKKEKAEAYCIAAPQKSGVRRVRTIDGWLIASFPTDGAHGDAAVRDGEPSITVLVMQEHADGCVSFLPWQCGGAKVSPSHVPDEETARQIAGQRLTLPITFSKYGREANTIRELEKMNREKLPEWQRSGWLSGELILLFDERFHANLCGHSLLYSKEYGLIEESEKNESKL